ncbi:hypothetical protein HELRODRAFT_170288 [Helobdella robusta]|uniref:Gem-associated protein 5 first beta-propeller domain-containing protein n=1 Tax=Helobdella robusta TaxID=6412 RepID=T1F2W0_HELRO|nr:hypothetical protein HELRODRAFT_170288 [Helobdella robusta]ESO07742.1 hypothetical protein HELRODRAFT_170288 [Helobdella robusta]
MSALKYMLPATPSWYYSRVMDSSSDGLICFGSRSSVNVWDLRHSNVRLYPFPVVHHNDKVAGVSFASADGRYDGDERAVVSTSGDKLFVTRFNLKTFKCTTESENDSHRNKVTVVQWSPLNENMIVSGDDKGSVCFWDMSKDVKVWYTCQHSDNYINSLSVSTSKHNEVAVGLKVGIILILELVDKKVEVLYKLRGHEENVQSLHWLRCHQDQDKDDVVSRLVSVCRDKTLKLWTLKKQRQNNWDVSTVSLFKKKSERWFSLSSIPDSDSQMIVSSANELYTINLTAAKLKLQPLVRNLKGHSLVIFNVVSWRRRSGSMGEGFDDVMMVTFSKGLFALGVGDNTIQTMTLNNGKCTNNRTFWQFMKSKVTAVRWHPTSDNLLAFGTEDGMVGLVNTAANAKTLVVI